MKNIYILSFLLLAVFTLNSCKKTKKAETETHKKGYTIDSQATTINWVAYKTTDKIPVKGSFTKINLKQQKSSTALEALNNVKFSIPVSSIFTKDTIRDAKLKKFFFGTLVQTNNILGSFALKENNSGVIKITMNGITKDIPVTYTIKDKLVSLEGVLDLDNWQAQTALKALNVACKDLHTGKDGISKTWSDVKIEATTSLEFN